MTSAGKSPVFQWEIHLIIQPVVDFPAIVMLLLRGWRFAYYKMARNGKNSSILNPHDDLVQGGPRIQVINGVITPANGLLNGYNPVAENKWAFLG